jgi:hypothetical protein
MNSILLRAIVGYYVNWKNVLHGTNNKICNNASLCGRIAYWRAPQTRDFTFMLHSKQDWERSPYQSSEVYISL